jgi:NitT/TauT family transport system substrate-binding protein
MFTSDAAIAGKRDGLVGVMAAYAEMFRWIADAKNEPAFLKYYAQAIPNASVTEAKFLYDFVAAPGHLATGLVLSQEQLDYIQKLNVDLGVQQAMLPFDKCADMSLAKQALKLVSS